MDAVGLSEISQACLRVPPVVLFWLCSRRLVAVVGCFTSSGRAKEGRKRDTCGHETCVYPITREKNCTNNDVVPSDGEYNGIQWGSPVGVALTFGQSMGLRYAGLCTGMLSRVSSTVQVACGGTDYLRSNGIHMVMFLKSKSALEGISVPKFVDALMLFPTYSYLAAFVIYDSELFYLGVEPGKRPRWGFSRSPGSGSSSEA